MPKRVPLYDAKAKLSALVREVREGQTVVITVHGIPAAELRPIATGTEQTFEERIAMLMERGEVVPPASNPRSETLPAGPAKKGALARFLAERD